MDIESSKSTLIKMPHCWKSHVAAHLQTVDLGNGESRVSSEKLLHQEVILNI